MSNKNRLIISLCILSFTAIFILIIVFVPQSNKETEKETIQKKYNINTNINTTDNNYIDNLIKDTSSKNEEQFINDINENNYDIETSSLDISYNTEQLDKLYTIYYIENKKINNEETIKKELKYYFNNEEITLDKIYTDQENFYTKLNWYINWYINRESNTIEYTNKEAIKDPNNYYIIFNKSEILIQFKENTLLNEETTIPCPYTALSTYLNKDIINMDAVDIKKIDNKDDEYYKTKKVVAFTFDDGPKAANTNLLLDELEKRNYKVTFFVVGYLADANRDVIKREYDLGHNVGTHTWAHKYLQQFKKDVEGMKESVISADNVVADVTGQPVKYFRPPGGIINETILNNIDHPFIMWSVDTRDWEKRDTELDAIAAVTSTKKTGDIVLFHDAHAPSIPGAIQAMDILSYDNFEFVNLDTLTRLQNITLEDHKTYRAIR